MSVNYIKPTSPGTDPFKVEGGKLDVPGNLAVKKLNEGGEYVKTALSFWDKILDFFGFHNWTYVQVNNEIGFVLVNLKKIQKIQDSVLSDFNKLFGFDVYEKSSDKELFFSLGKVPYTHGNNTASISTYLSKIDRQIKLYKEIVELSSHERDELVLEKKLESKVFSNYKEKLRNDSRNSSPASSKAGSPVRTG